MKKYLLASILCAVPFAALAADLPVKAPMAPPVALFNWTGFYVGGNFGVGLSRNIFTGDEFNQWGNTDDFGPSNPLGSHIGLGPVGGFQAGYNYKLATAPIVLGIEGSFDFASLKGSNQHSNGFVNDSTDFGIAFTSRDFSSAETLSTKSKNLATIAGRFGVTSGPEDKTMWFVKGGAAYSRTDYAISGGGKFQKVDYDNCGNFPFPCVDPFDSYAFNSSDTLTGRSNRWGYVVGTGVEFGLWGNWTTKIEYDFMDFGNHNVAMAGTWTNFGNDTPAGPGFYTKNVTRILNVNEQVHTVTVGLNYKFTN